MSNRLHNMIDRDERRRHDAAFDPQPDEADIDRYEQARQDDDSEMMDAIRWGDWRQLERERKAENE